MKKVFINIFIISCIAACPSFAQLKVNTNGNVSVKSITGTPLSPLCIGSNGDTIFNIHSVNLSKNGIYTKAKNDKTQWAYGGETYGLSNGMNFNVGLKGEANTSNNIYKGKGRAFGVIGCAGNATTGWNYGIFGRLLGSCDGAAVYGTTSVEENGIQLSQRYAGYFNGDVGISGDLTVNGSIDGVMLYEAAGAELMETACCNSTAQESVKDKLSGLSTISYYKSTPLKAQAVAEDTAVAERSNNTIELQNMSKRHYGFSAEQLEEIYPDLVYTNDNGTKCINYMEMIPLLVQAINELSAKVAELEAPGIVKRTAPQATDIAGTATEDTAVLQQNKPNPFTGTTTISMNIPASAKTAQLCIYDLTGKQLKEINIAERGNTSLSFSAETMSAGMYIYSLIIDTKIIGTKRMVIRN